MTDQDILQWVALNPAAAVFLALFVIVVCIELGDPR